MPSLQSNTHTPYTHTFTYANTHWHSPPHPPHTHTHTHTKRPPSLSASSAHHWWTAEGQKPSSHLPDLPYANKSPAWPLPVCTSTRWPPGPVPIPCATSTPEDLFIITTVQSTPIQETGCLAAAAKAELSYLGINPLLNVVLQVWL